MENRTEQIEGLQEMLDSFENKVSELVMEGRDLARGMENYGGRVGREGQQLNAYFVRRLQSFLECNEMFRFDHARETLEDEIEEINAGVYDEEEAL